MHDGNVLDPVYIPKLYHYKPQPKDNIEYDNRFYKSKSYNIFPNEYYNPNWSTKTQTKPVNDSTYSPYPIIIKYPNSNTIQKYDDSWDDIIKNKQFNMWGSMFLYDDKIRNVIEYRQYSPFDDKTNNYYKTYIQYNIKSNEMFYIVRKQNDLTVDILDKNWHRYNILSPHLPKNIEKTFYNDLYDIYVDKLKTVNISTGINTLSQQISNDYKMPVIFEQMNYTNTFVYNKEYIKDIDNYIQYRYNFDNSSTILYMTINSQSHNIKKNIEITSNTITNKLDIDNIYNSERIYRSDKYTMTLNNQKVIQQSVNDDINIQYNSNNKTTNIQITNHKITITNSKVTIVVDSNGDINIQADGNVNMTQSNIYMNAG